MHIQNRLSPVFSFWIICSILLSCSGGKQTTTAPANPSITAAIQANQWVFTAQNVQPQSGRSRYVNGSYDVRLNNDSITVYLPYFGNSYGGVDVMSGKGPLDFTSTHFTLTNEQNKKGGWDVTIKTNDYSEVRSMSFTLYDNGKAMLSVILTSRSSISFTGNIRPLK